MHGRAPGMNCSTPRHSRHCPHAPGVHEECLISMQGSVPNNNQCAVLRVRTAHGFSKPKRFSHVGVNACFGLFELHCKRPYTFVVLALLIPDFRPLGGIALADLTFSPTSRSRSSARCGRYTGLSPEDMSGRVVYLLRTAIEFDRQRHRPYRIAIPAPGMASSRYFFSRTSISALRPRRSPRFRKRSSSRCRRVSPRR